MQKSNTVPKSNFYAKSFMIRLGKIFSNLSIFFLVLSLSGILSFVASAFVLIIGFVIVVLSIGTIFILVPNFGDLWLSSIEVTGNLATFFLNNFFIFVGLTILFAIVSLVILAFDKQNKHVARIVISSIVIAVAIISIVVLLVGGMK